MPTFVSAARICGAFRFMPECKLHGTIPQLLALRWCQLVHPRTVPLHDQGADRLLCRTFLERFHMWFMPSGRASVKLVTLTALAAAALSGRASPELAMGHACFRTCASHHVCCQPPKRPRRKCLPENRDGTLPCARPGTLLIHEPESAPGTKGQEGQGGGLVRLQTWPRLARHQGISSSVDIKLGSR